VAQVGDRRLLGELLIEAGLVKREDLEKALEEQRLRGGRLCYHLMRLGRVTPGSLFVFLQDHFGIIAPDLLDILRRRPLVDLIPPSLAHFYQMVPLRKEGDRLLLALAYVDNPSLIPAVEELTGLKVEPVICPPGLIQESLSRFFSTEEEPGVIRGVMEDSLLVLSDPSQDIFPMSPDSLKESASPVVWLRALMAESVKRRCRELLIEPLEEGLRVSFRQPEGPEALRVLPTSLHAGLGMVLEDLSKMAARGRTVPREGRFRLRLGERRLTVVVTSLPSLYGDAYHLRIVEERIRKESLEEMLEDYPQARSSLEASLSARKGLLLLAVPEGHYRERILAALVQSVRWEAGRVIFLAAGQSPPLPGMDVRSLEEARAGALAEAIRAAIRDHPDLLAVHRIETREEAEMLFEAGKERLVIAGLRGSDAFEALEWLSHAGLLQQVREGRLCGILGARLVERICEHCRRRYDLLEEFPNLISEPHPGGLYFANTGCRACRGAGMVDLEPAFEFLPGDAVLWDRLTRPSLPGGVRREGSRSGVKTLYASVLARAAAGEVDVREPLRLLLVEGRSAG
jgi:type IV pilus assembly protein PilB